MATPETNFEALGRSWRFKFGIGAMCRLERAMGGKPFGVIIGEMLPGLGLADLDDPAKVAGAMDRLRFTHLVALLGAGLGGESEDTVAEIVDELGLELALKLIFERAEDDLPLEKPGPKKAAAPRQKRRNA